MSDIETALELLYSDERLTSNLTDDQAKALLHWAAEKIRQGVTVATVRSAATQANRDSFASPDAVVAAADSALPHAPMVAVSTSHTGDVPVMAGAGSASELATMATQPPKTLLTHQPIRPRQPISRPRRRHRLRFQR